MPPPPAQHAAARSRSGATPFRGRGSDWRAGLGVVTFGRFLAAIAPVERRVVGQDGCVQALQRFSGVDAEFAGEQVAGTPVGGERLGLPATAIQRQHELAVQPLPQRMLGGQPLQLAGERCRAGPSARSASIRASSAASRSSSRRAASGRMNA